MDLVHGFCETLALDIDPLPFRTVINGKLALEDVAEEWYRMRVPPGLLSWRQRDLECCDLGGCAGGLADRLARDGALGGQHGCHRERRLGGSGSK